MAKKKIEESAAVENKKAAASKPKTDYQKHQDSWQSKKEQEAERSSSIDPEYQKHPKFAKFNSQLGDRNHDK